MLRWILVLIAASVPGVGAEEIEFVTTELPWAVVDRGYYPSPLEVRSSGKCPSGGIGYELVGGVLPPGLRLSRLGYFSGVPTSLGNFLIRVRASNGCSWTAKLFTLTVSSEPVITLIPASLELVWRAGEKPPTGSIRIVSSWPRLAYQIRASDDCVRVSTERGNAVSHNEGAAEDSIYVVGVVRKPGRCSVSIEASAWQAHAGRASVDLVVEPETLPVP
jgi:hypothetical protein